MPRPPSRGGVTSQFGMRTHPITGQYRMHYGQDTIGEGNWAVADGEVVYMGYDGTGHGFGIVVGIRCAFNPRIIAWVAHHAALSVAAVGEKTKEGATRTGPIGRTGAATGIHAHTEFRIDGAATPGSGTAIDPRDVYAGKYGAGGGGSSSTSPTSRIYEEDDDMSIKIIAHVKGDGTTEEVAAVCPEFENGYFIAKGNTPVALGLLRTYSPTLDGKPHYKMDRDQYLGALEAAKAARAAYVAGRPKITVDAGQLKITADNADVVEALEALGVKLVADLPAEIDRYADGKKQS